MDNIIRIKANYSFWRHPIQWIKDIKYRRTLEALMNWDWEHGGKEKFYEEMSKVVGSEGTC